ncbi:MAG: HEAT repeat domain-containing protein [Planctomycetota bacterium]|nr:HEAT repeat domain-containing protein [Planctomycetota bacterium]
MAASEQLKVLVDQMPNPDSRGMYCTDIDKQKIEKAIAEIQQGGRENILGLIELLVPPGEGDDTKAHYALHCVGNHVLKIKDEKARREFSETLAAQLGGQRPKPVQAYLCQELQWAGRREATEALGKLLTDADLCEPAALALVAIHDGAAEQFRAALPQAKGKCRLNVIQGLGAVRDAQSVDGLKPALGDPDREVRLAAGWGLAQIGDASSVDALLKAADAEPGWERIQATKHCLVLAEKLLAAGKKAEATKIYSRLRDTRQQPSEAYVRQAAEKALAATQ